MILTRNFQWITKKPEISLKWPNQISVALNSLFNMSAGPFDWFNSYYLINVCVPFFIYFYWAHVLIIIIKEKIKFQNKKKIKPQEKKNDSFKSRRIVHELFTFLYNLKIINLIYLNLCHISKEISICKMWMNLRATISCFYWNGSPLMNDLYFGDSRWFNSNVTSLKWKKKKLVLFLQ